LRLLPSIGRRDFEIVAVAANGAVGFRIAVDQIATPIELEPAALIENVAQHGPAALDARLCARVRQAEPPGEFELGESLDLRELQRLAVWLRDLADQLVEPCARPPPLPLRLI
jgi:hypothetical protein